MRSTQVILAAVALLSAGGAVAGERVSDLDYLKASRCKGLASAQIGGLDAAALDAFIKEQGKVRSDYVIRKGKDEASRAQREGRKWQDDRKAKLVAEAEGPCQVYKAA